METLFGPPSLACLNMEVNQSVAEYRESRWPKVGFDCRDRIYVQPIASRGARQVAGVAVVAAFIRAYFHVPVHVLPALQLQSTAKASVEGGREREGEGEDEGEPRGCDGAHAV